MRNIHFGTVIQGTLRNEDLIPAFTGEIEYLSAGYLDADIANLYHIAQETIDLYDQDSEVNEEIASEIVNDLIDVLNGYAPPMAYFGSLDGDGADFGWWIDSNRITDMMHTAQETCNPEEKWITDCDCQSTDCTDRHGYILQVNDHGNTTLMDTDRNVIWSIV